MENVYFKYWDQEEIKWNQSKFSNSWKSEKDGWDNNEQM